MTPVHDHSGPARLLDVVAGRSAAALTTWLAVQPKGFRDQVEVVAMDGFAGYKTAVTAVVPDAVAVMDPFHVVALAGTKLDLVRRHPAPDPGPAWPPEIRSTGSGAVPAPACSCCQPASTTA